MSQVTVITSRDNPLLQRVRKLTRSPGGYRRDGWVWIEGEHLCQVRSTKGSPVPQAVIAESAWAASSALRGLAQAAQRVARVPDTLFAGLSALESPAGLGYLIECPEPPVLEAAAATVVLDRVQDAGNVGSILRSAAAMGFSQVIALEGTAALWSPKVLRAGMGAHFGLSMRESAHVDDVAALSVPVFATSSHAATSIDETVLPFPCAWVFGHEGQGVGAPLQALCQQTLRIPQPGGEESLNVAAAAAVCLYAARAGRRG